MQLTSLNKVCNANAIAEVAEIQKYYMNASVLTRKERKVNLSEVAENGKDEEALNLLLLSSISL